MMARVEDIFLYITNFFHVKNMDEIMTKWSIGMTDMCLKIFRFIIREQ